MKFGTALKHLALFITLLIMLVGVACSGKRSWDGITWLSRKLEGAIPLSEEEIAGMRKASFPANFIKEPGGDFYLIWRYSATLWCGLQR